jgi:hypothetical protein
VRSQSFTSSLTYRNTETFVSELEVKSHLSDMTGNALFVTVNQYLIKRFIICGFRLPAESQQGRESSLLSFLPQAASRNSCFAHLRNFQK